MTKPLGASPKCDGPGAGADGDAAPCSPPSEAAVASGAFADEEVAATAGDATGAEGAGVGEVGIEEAGGGDAAMVGKVL